MANTKNKGLNVNIKSFLAAIVVIFILMVVSYLLTILVPGGNYARIPDTSGNLQIDPNGTFSSVKGGIPFWKWLLSPILVLGASGNTTLIAVIAFVAIIVWRIQKANAELKQEYALGRK